MRDKDSNLQPLVMHSTLGPECLYVMETSVKTLLNDYDSYQKNYSNILEVLKLLHASFKLKNIFYSELNISLFMFLQGLKKVKEKYFW